MVSQIIRLRIFGISIIATRKCSITNEKIVHDCISSHWRDSSDSKLMAMQFGIPHNKRLDCKQLNPMAQKILKRFWWVSYSHNKMPCTVNIIQPRIEVFLNSYRSFDLIMHLLIIYSYITGSKKLLQESEVLPRVWCRKRLTQEMRRWM